MKILLSAWILLFLRINLNFGHYIRPAGNEDSAVSEVKDGSGVAFVNPKAQQRTLREILYYHIIERPYEKETIQTPSHQDTTERSFTNSHGYQFLNYDGEPSSDESNVLYELIKELEEQNDGNDEDHDNVNDDENEVDIGLHQEEEADEEEAETTTEPKRLTDKEVKEAYKTRSYLFDQARQRYLPKRMVPVDAIVRRKRQAEFGTIPQSPQLSGDAEKDAYIQPNTYGMNLKPDGGYVWNNLNNPATYYEVEQPQNGDQSGGQNKPQSLEPTQPPADIYTPPAPAPENSNSDSSEDIYVNSDRLPAVLSAGNEGSNEKPPKDISEESEANNESLNEESAEVPIAPVVNESQESNESGAKYPTDAILNENAPEAQDGSAPVPENPEQVDTAEKPGSNENPSGETKPQYEQPGSEVDNASGDSNESEGEKIREIPEAPTLPRLNYDNLPDYIRQAISSTEKTESYEQTDNPYVNPQLKPEDKKEIEDKMEGIFATVQPIEDIPKTYGMNLTSDGDHVWNNLVNPPVSYDVGSTASNQEQGTTQVPAISEQPEIQNPSVEPSSPENNKDSEEATNVEEQPENPKPSQEEVIPNENNAQIEQPAEPIEPNAPSEPIAPITPEQPTEPNQPENKPESPVEPEIPLEPKEPIIPVEPGIPLEPKEPIIPVEPERPVEPVTPEEPKNPEANVPEPGSDESEDIPKPNESHPSEESDLPEEEESYEQTDNPYVNPQLNPEDKKENEDKMEGIFATVQPVEDIPMTYGMNLTSDGGHVWNNLVNPPVSYDVGSTASNQEQGTTQVPAISEQPEIQNPSVEPSSPVDNKDSEEAINVEEQPENPKPSQEEVIPNENNAQIEQPAEPIEPNAPSEPIEPITPEQPTEPKQPENKPESPVEPEIPLEPKEPIIPVEPEKPVEPVTPEEPKNPEANVPEPGSDEREDIPKPNESGSSEEPDLPEEEEQDLAHPKPEDDDNKPDIMNELLKSEQFWKWLGEWTATYMELLEKHIRKIAIQEICNREKLGSQICLRDDQPKNSGPEKDGKLFIDGREITLTHSDNIASSRKRGHKVDKGHKIDATTIYGNSVGNEKVTNVFIFNPDNAKEILEELKPENDSKVEFTIDDRIKEELKEPEKEDKEGEFTEAEDDEEEKESESDEIISEKESGDDKKEVEDVKEINEPNKAISSELNKEDEDENQGKPVEA